MQRLLLLLLLCCSFLSTAQVTNEGEPVSWEFTKKSSIEPISLSKVDIQKLRKEDDVKDKIFTKPFRIGIPHKVDYGLDKGGTWTELPNGDRIWRILFHSKDAIHLSVNFNSFFLPEGGNIYLYNDDKTDLLGAYTDTQNNDNEVLGTWFVDGDKLWVEYYEPKEVKGQGKLHLSSIIHGYRLGNIYQKGYYNEIKKGLNDSGDCNHDVNCPIGADFESQRDLLKKSVAFLNMGDGFVCSGALINNTSEDKTPYFLTADHCFERDVGEDPADPSLFSMRFNWISPNPICAATDDSSNTSNPDEFTISSSTLRARNSDSDVALVEINSAIPSSWDITYAGWDRTDNNPTFEVGIHHPQGDIMKICRDDTGAIKASNGGTQVWLVGGLNDGIGTGNGWELGVTEGGSSGSPLFDQNGRIIGQLFGGEALCSGTEDNDDFDVYGRFATSWDNGSASSTRLKDWLDNGNLNPTTLDALGNVLAVNNQFLEQNITLFPNPTSGAVQIRVKKIINDLEYQVYNVLGQTLKSNKLQNNEIINLDNLPSDIYFIKISEIGTNKSLVKKIVLEK